MSLLFSIYTFWNDFNPNISLAREKNLKIVKKSKKKKKVNKNFLGRLGSCGRSGEGKQTIFFLGLKAVVTTAENCAYAIQCVVIRTSKSIPKWMDFGELFSFFLLYRRVWQTTVDLPGDMEIKYRYALCSFPKAANSNKNERVIVHRWESSVQPRELITQGEY